jgi:hypothetical protein
MHIQLLIEFLICPRAFLFLLYSLGVLGVGSDPVVYLPVSKEPPDLDNMPMGMLTSAMPPEAVAPADADSVISLNLI